MKFFSALNTHYSIFPLSPCIASYPILPVQTITASTNIIDTVAPFCKPYPYPRTCVTLDFIINTFTKHAIYKGNDDYPYLAGLSVSAVKPALVEYALSFEVKISIDTYLNYYLQQQLHYFGMDASLSINYLNMLKGYYINIATNFTPILTKLL